LARGGGAALQRTGKEVPLPEKKRIVAGGARTGGKKKKIPIRKRNRVLCSAKRGGKKGDAANNAVKRGTWKKMKKKKIGSLKGVCKTLTYLLKRSGRVFYNSSRDPPREEGFLPGKKKDFSPWVSSCRKGS